MSLSSRRNGEGHLQILSQSVYILLPILNKINVSAMEFVQMSWIYDGFISTAVYSRFLFTTFLFEVDQWKQIYTNIFLKKEESAVVY